MIQPGVIAASIALGTEFSTKALTAFQRHAIIRFVLNSHDIQRSNKTRAGCGYWLLVLLTASIILIQIGAAWRITQIPPALAAQVSLSLPLEFVGGLLWAGVFALLTYWLVRRRRRGVRLTTAALGVFALYNGVRWLVFTRADYESERLPFLLVAMSVFVILAVVVVWRRPQQMEKSLDDTESED